MERPALAGLLKQDDAALLAWRRQAREELECNPADTALLAVYDQTTSEATTRTAASWGLHPARTSPLMHSGRPPQR
jgi:hypothetical protein